MSTYISTGGLDERWETVFSWMERPKVMDVIYPICIVIDDVIYVPVDDPFIIINSVYFSELRALDMSEIYTDTYFTRNSELIPVIRHRGHCGDSIFGYLGAYAIIDTGEGECVVPSTIVRISEDTIESIEGTAQDLCDKDIYSPLVGEDIYDTVISLPWRENVLNMFIDQNEECTSKQLVDCLLSHGVPEEDISPILQCLVSGVDLNTHTLFGKDYTSLLMDLVL